MPHVDQGGWRDRPAERAPRDRRRPSEPVGVMPAKGAMETTSAVASDRRQTQDAGVLVEDVAKAYRARGRAPVEALAGVSVHAAPGEVLAVVGPSGCGKSTLLELVCGLQEPDRGRIEAPEAVLMPQGDLLLPWASALDNAALALRVRGLRREEARARAAPAFAEFGLTGFERAKPSELSGGMRQRV